MFKDPIPFTLRKPEHPFFNPFALLLYVFCAPALVHQADLSDAEKILRQFDLASKFGPCTDVTRLDRWERAFNLVS